MTTGTRWAWADIDLGALDHNTGVIAEAVSPAAVWAVVKADGYGHGAAAIAEQALRSGAAGLCVAFVQEGVALRAAGIDAPILVLSEQPLDQVPMLIATGLVPTVYTAAYADAVAAAQLAIRPGATREVHVKFDTGMRRVGAQPSAARALLTHVRSLPALRIGGIFTHLACADEPASASNAAQLAEFESVLGLLGELGIDRVGPDRPAVHAANSAAALGVAASRYDFVRAGIAIYGISPGRGVDDLASDLRPVLSLRARVSHLKRVSAGDGVSYGLRHRFGRDTIVATVPIGYADGVPRRLGTLPDRPGAEVLIGGRRRPIVGVVTMDQLMVDVGDDQPSHDGASRVAVGDEVVLIGRQGNELIRAEDWAERLGTIGYEIVCGISARVPRRVHPATGSPS
jgi:alanine racemase